MGHRKYPNKMNVKSAELVHLPVMCVGYPPKALDYPWPLCGLVAHMDDPEWTDEACNCQRCKNKAAWRKENAGGQIRMRLE